MFVFKTSKWLEYVIKIPVTLLCNVCFATDLAGVHFRLVFLYFFIRASVYYQFIISLLSVQISVLTAVR